MLLPPSPANTIGVMLPGRATNVDDPTCKRLPGLKDPIPTLPFLSTRKLVALDDPIAKLACPAGALTESNAPGLVVPTPTFPAPSITKGLVSFAESSAHIVYPLPRFERRNAVLRPAVEVATANAAPGVVVPTPIPNPPDIVVVAVPVPRLMSLPEIVRSPIISRTVRGEGVPIPTLPLLSILIRSLPPVENASRSIPALKIPVLVSARKESAGTDTAPSAKYKVEVAIKDRIEKSV